jgi:phospholipid-translocating ATPase
VLLRENDQVPADIVVLSTSEPDGLCYLETNNFDGETNLKPRKSLKAMSSLRSEEDVKHASFFLDSEPPHQNLYLYNGVLPYRPSADRRESNLYRSTNFCYAAAQSGTWRGSFGLVVFTGTDTKIVLNGGSTPSKRSKIEKETNFNVVMNFVILIGMCLATAIASRVYDGMDDTSARFFEEGSNPSSSSIVNAIVTFV